MKSLDRNVWHSMIFYSLCKSRLYTVSVYLLIVLYGVQNYEKVQTLLIVLYGVQNDEKVQTLFIVLYAVQNYEKVQTLRRDVYGSETWSMTYRCENDLFTFSSYYGISFPDILAIRTQYSSLCDDQPCLFGHISRSTATAGPPPCCTHSNSGTSCILDKANLHWLL